MTRTQEQKNSKNGKNTRMTRTLEKQKIYFFSNVLIHCIAQHPGLISEFGNYFIAYRIESSYKGQNAQ